MGKLIIFAFLMVFLNVHYINDNEKEVDVEFGENQKLKKFTGGFFNTSESRGVRDLFNFLRLATESPVSSLVHVDLRGNFRKGSKLSAKTFEKSGYHVSVICEGGISVCECYVREVGSFDKNYIRDLLEINSMRFQSPDGRGNKFEDAEVMGDTVLWRQGAVIAIWKGNSFFVCNKEFLDRYIKKHNSIKKEKERKFDLPQISVPSMRSEPDTLSADVRDGSVARNPNFINFQVPEIDPELLKLIRSDKPVADIQFQRNSGDKLKVDVVRDALPLGLLAGVALKTKNPYLRAAKWLVVAAGPILGDSSLTAGDESVSAEKIHEQTFREFGQ